MAVSDGQSVVMYGERQASQEALMTPGPLIQQTPETTSPVVTEPPAATPAGTDYIINANTEKFHYPSCKSVGQMKESNKVFYTGTREELLAKGYDPCGNCHP